MICYGNIIKIREHIIDWDSMKYYLVVKKNGQCLNMPIKEILKMRCGRQTLKAPG